MDCNMVDNLEDSRKILIGLRNILFALGEEFEAEQRDDGMDYTLNLIAQDLDRVSEMISSCITDD